MGLRTVHVPFIQQNMLPSMFSILMFTMYMILWKKVSLENGSLSLLDNGSNENEKIDEKYCVLVPTCIQRTWSSNEYFLSKRANDKVSYQ